MTIQAARAEVRSYTSEYLSADAGKDRIQGVDSNGTLVQKGNIGAGEGQLTSTGLHGFFGNVYGRTDI